MGTIQLHPMILAQLDKIRRHCLWNKKTENGEKCNSLAACDMLLVLLLLGTARRDRPVKPLSGSFPSQVRDFVRSALYDPNHGYFSKRSGPVGVLDSAIRFHKLEGRTAYMKHLDKLYKMHDISWFTPVELFKPWYAYAIAASILRTANLSVPLKIYEIGGGSGTCAKCVLDYMMLNAPPKVYNNMKYISVEISSSLAEKQLETVGEVQSHLSKFTVEHRDATDIAGWGCKDPQPCWVLMLESYLKGDIHAAVTFFWWKCQDNPVSLPLDIYRSTPKALVDQDAYSISVGSCPRVAQLEAESSQVCEVYKPLQDPLVSRCSEIVGMNEENPSLREKLSFAAKGLVSKVFPKPRRAWLPTGCLKDGKTLDHPNYLDAQGDADIFFPTDFLLLEQIDHHCSGFSKDQMKRGAFKPVKSRRTIILDSAAFMEEFGMPLKTRTKDGYNPLLDDFRNTKFYLSVPTHNKK
uniref:Protein arginine methyltransferase NDUFAF7 n=1 Tax=Aegilops tauschii TaxID=37682 RepID=M8BUL5_AEGTA